MKLAIISDVHGNTEAFNKFLNVIEEEKVEKILNLGDFVRGENPDAIMDYMMKDDRFLNITGNHEEGYCKECYCGKNKSDDKYLEWIKTQVSQRVIQVNGFKILMVHSRPSSNKLPPLLYNGSSLDEFMSDYPDHADLICFGHTHIQLFIENFYGKRILNPGSLGLAIDGKVNFAIIEIENKDIQYKFIKLNI